VAMISMQASPLMWEDDQAHCGRILTSFWKTRKTNKPVNHVSINDDCQHIV
jgi:hypothetical protein